MRPAVSIAKLFSIRSFRLLFAFGKSFILFIFFFCSASWINLSTYRQPRVYGVAKQENAQIKCIVDANPPEVDFKWTFNNSAESIDVAASHVSRHGEQRRKVFAQF